MTGIPIRQCNYLPIRHSIYYVRRSRRYELMAEWHRLKDLKRWRAFDQMSTTRYPVEGFKIRGPVKDV